MSRIEMDMRKVLVERLDRAPSRKWQNLTSVILSVERSEATILLCCS